MFSFTRSYRKIINKLKEEPLVVILQDESSSIKEDLRDKLIHFSNNIKGYDIYSYNFSDKLYDGFTIKMMGTQLIIQKP